MIAEIMRQLRAINAASTVMNSQPHIPPKLNTDNANRAKK